MNRVRRDDIIDALETADDTACGYDRNGVTALSWGASVAVQLVKALVLALLHISDQLNDISVAIENHE